jgi:hypothetical protein
LLFTAKSSFCVFPTILKENSIYFEIVGKTQKEDLAVNNKFKEKISDLCTLSSFWFKNYFGKN